ncbi:MAG: hypothetical protein IAA81_04770 [Spirochaetes bacterium]|uniref:Uncharacterized protein n=1 Tax=Candidatus Gallitreponema excrementavium TaxID=2840840 RepID=A0A9D9HPF1_9SPIR|nr:hypothetical protein [Candidatus Gallitreponema excrementavium]
MCSKDFDKSNIEKCTYEELIGIDKISRKDKTQEESSDCVDYEVLKNAFDFANSCRDKEIDRFWSRGLYFWGFMVASFTAYFVTFSNIIPRKSEDYIDLSFEQFLLIPFMGKLILFIISFVIFIFCLSWLFVHKGSKYWQENWEEHIYQLEKNYMGRIYGTHLDTEKNNFSRCPCSVKGYDYSVSKISLLCSLLLAVLSFCLCLFHSFLMIDCLIVCIKENKECLKCVITLFIVILAIFFLGFYRCNIKGNSGTCKKNGVFYKVGEKVWVSNAHNESPTSETKR